MEIDIRLSPMDNYKSFQMIISSYSFPYSQVVKDGPFHLCKVSLNPPLQLNLLQYPILNFTSGKVQTIRLFIHELNATKHSQLKFQLNAVLGDPFPPNSNNFKVYFGVAIFTSENRHSLLLRKGMNISGNAPTRDPTVTLNLDLKSMNISKMYSYTIAGNLSLFSGAERLQVSCFVKNGFDGAVQLYSIGLTPISGSDTCNYVDFDQSTETASSVNDKVTSGLGKRIHGCSSTGEGPEIFKFGIGLSLAEGSSLPLTQFKVGVAISNRMSILEEKDVLFTIVPTGSSPLSASNTNLYESSKHVPFLWENCDLRKLKSLEGIALRFMEEYAQFNSTDGPGSISLTLKVGKTCPLFNQFIPTKVLFRITYRAEIVDSDNLNLLIHAYITYNGVELIKQLITKIGRRLTKGLTMSCDSRPSSPYLRALSEETIRTNTFMVNYLIRPAMCTYGDYELTLEINNPKVCICNARLNRLGSNLMMDSMEIPGFEKNLYGHSCFSKVSIEIKKLTRIAYEGFEHQNFLTDSATLSLSVAINSKQAQTPFTINATLKTNSTWLKTLTSNFAMDLKDPQNGFTATGIVPEDSAQFFLIVLKQNEASQVHLLHVGIGQKGENIPCVSLNSTCYGSSRNTGSGYDVCQGYNIQISTCYRKYSGEADNDKFTLKLYLTLTEPNVSSPGNIISLYININGVEYTTKLTEASTPNFCQVEDGIDIVTNFSGSSIPEAQNGVFSNVSFFLNLTAKSNCSLQVCIQSDITTTMPSMQFDQVFLLSDEDPSVLYPSLMPFQNIKGNSLACSQPNFECLKLGRLEFLQPYNDTLPYIRMKVSLRFNDANINIDDSINPIMVYIGDAITKYINVRVRRSALSDYHAHLIMNISVMDPVKTLGSGDELRVSLKLQMDPNSINEIIPISIKMNTPPLIKEIISMHSNCIPGKTCGRVASVLFKYKSEDPINIKINMSNTCASITGVPPQGQSFDWNFNHAGEPIWAVDTKQDIIYFCYRSPFKRGLRCFSYNVNKKARMELPSYISALLGIQNSIVYFEDKLGQSSEALVWTNSDYQGDSHGISKNGKIILLWANTCLN
ncbi:unnamed protein product [Lepeophtheirus salmonis]|uniref:(salmon louse) hypothetical protein n=1 Tax=Lepeophtheirus salmonis TaxID=72036 RepID=A0A7R8H0L0_LEPSM|nr:unnamed protein product [Lepeophtheirus salmonis]CAF2772531.1 unnamed protein product [Lepeophtheirus salmonis]